MYYWLSLRLPEYFPRRA
ncbi:hypothetical protein KKC91_01170 [bacterium]|nr:hypothetical protein [bacterium]